ncbi:EAL and modified HD-GYP domain-containing signal transduction protein [Thermodesulfobium acidiphilum]|uniref:EAL and modified HD-GYP domain-containing signal transduction protein n=1 Tax=Thermodesulfobium acidiphilum TaxID=1794699 RepID=A0A2R4W2F8_THEAF|nr:HDOD domain-containing protein [Thermodesulfobium acidiphilum]AWB10842.1 EAL and modified HD-GYP domain-containing signal transduction protein [Thermodesulfobium acidiphilum]
MSSFIARQPILNADKKTFGYEVLYRDSNKNEFPEENPEEASLKVLVDLFTNYGITYIGKGLPIFINTPLYTLKKSLPPFPKESIFFEINQTEINNNFDLSFIKELHYSSFNLSYQGSDLPHQSILRFFNAIKIDFSIAPKEKRSLLPKYIPQNKVLIAHKIENNLLYEEALEEGYKLFQGFYFSKPETLTKKNFTASQIEILNIIKMLLSENLKWDRIEKEIKKNAYLTIKILKLVNSSFFGFRCEVKSVLQAIVLLGRKQMIKWLIMILLTEKTTAPLELLKITLTRARLMQLLAQETSKKFKEDEYYLIGLLSLFDVITGFSKENLLIHLPLSETISNAIKGVDNPQTRSYLQALKLVELYEKGDWEKVISMCYELRIRHERMGNLYMEAISWADETLESIA